MNGTEYRVVCPDGHVAGGVDCGARFEHRGDARKFATECDLDSGHDAAICGAGIHVVQVANWRTIR